MKWILPVILLGFISIALADDSKQRWTVNLSDGSRVMGTVPVTTLKVRSRIIGEAVVEVANIRRIEADTDHVNVMISVAGGDKLKGTPVEKSLPFDTLMGRVAVPWDKITGIFSELRPDDAALKEGLLAYYPFHDDAQDHSGNLQHGKANGAVFEGGGIRFRGDASSYVQIPRSQPMEPENEISISMWIKGVPGQAAGGGWGTLLRKMDHCQPGFGIRGGGVSAFCVGGPNPCSGGRTTSVSFLPFDETKWQHIAMTFSLDEKLITTYQDGAKVNSAAITDAMVHSGDLFIGGADVASDDGGFRGLVRDVRIYKRALKALEIQALAAAAPAP